MQEKTSVCSHRASDVRVYRWIDKFLSSRIESRPPLIDIRTRNQFISRHVYGATHFEGLFGTDGLFERLSELPPPQHRLDLGILASTLDESMGATSLLISRGYQGAIPLTFECVASLLPIEIGDFSRPLWKPAPILLAAFPNLLPNVPKRTALDIGAGAGRDAAWLSMHGFQVTTVDRDPKLTAKTTRLATRRSYKPWFCDSNIPNGLVYGVTRTLGVHLSDDQCFFRANASGLLLVVRFLRRGVLDHLWEAVLPGGFVVYEHFLRGCENFGGPKKPSQMLQPGELRQIFSADRGFTVWQDTQSRLPDGRPITRFVARKQITDQPS